jgi:HTH-type transcriptional regulator/antitoxin HigA
MPADIDLELLSLTKDGIQSDRDYEQALEIMDRLIENYDANLVLIEALSIVIGDYEDAAEAIHGLRSQINPAIATLTVLMDQHRLTAQDFKSEIGNEGIVMQILEGERELSSENISKLAKRFGISPSLFS